METEKSLGDGAALGGGGGVAARNPSRQFETTVRDNERLRRETTLVLLFAPGDDHEGVVGQGTLKLERFIGG
jgi:hypothetical protein